MEQNKEHIIQELFPGYFKNELSVEDIKRVDEWRQLSDNNETEFLRVKKVWDLTEVLNQMKAFDTSSALNKFRQNIKSNKNTLWGTLQRIAAVLILPLIVYSGILSYSRFNGNENLEAQVVWQEFQAIPGAISNFVLPDGTKVCLNMESTIQFPSTFGKENREVKLSGEAFFDVTHNPESPFLVNTGKVNVEVLGTKFNVNNYSDSEIMEVVLESGKVGLYSGDYEDKKELGKLFPGERVTYIKKNNSLTVDKVAVADFTSWRNGILVFSDTPMQEVVSRLGRWFNTDIELVDGELKEYFYTATFIDENLKQVLELLQHSTPMDYEIVQKRTLKDGSYTKEKIRIFKKK